tara:strand:+ start:1081 stop:2508 length:1428 start_codon:yes stop_codon:yes gene_type:complete
MINKSKVVNSHFNLGVSFYDFTIPAQFPNHILRFRNDRASKLIDLDYLDDNQWIEYFGKFVKFPGVKHKPLALKYHGHQFGYYNSELGDGRGFLLAQFLDKNNVLWDLGTKGSGQTKYSRGGDGRLTLKGAVRELLATEFLTSLGVPTSQTFSIVETAEQLQRNDEPSPTRSAVLVRRSNSHIRIGTFQRLKYLNEYENIALLLKHLRENYFTNIKPNKSLKTLAENIFLESVKRIAESIGRIIVAGFVHGVLNTDNFNVTGEVFDYGPWRFIEFANTYFTAAYFDNNGRYSYGRQPEAALWALTQLGKSLDHFIDEKIIIEILNQFSKNFHISLKKHFCWRMGIEDIDSKNLNEIMIILLNESEKNKIDYANIFYDFYGGRDSIIDCIKSKNGKKYKINDFSKVVSILKESIPTNGALQKKHELDNNRQNMLVNEVEDIWSEIDENDNWELLEEKIYNVRKLGNLLESEKLVNL